MLRAYAGAQEETAALLEELRASKPHVGWSHPEWLVKQWLKRLGPEATQELLAWNNRPPPVLARTNLLRTSAEALCARWRRSPTLDAARTALLLLWRLSAKMHLLCFAVSVTIVNEHASSLRWTEEGVSYEPVEAGGSPAPALPARPSRKALRRCADGVAHGARFATQIGCFPESFTPSEFRRRSLPFPRLPMG